MDNSFYTVDEIKCKIDTAIQLSIYFSDKEVWDDLLETKRRLYKQFGIEEK